MIDITQMSVSDIRPGQLQNYGGQKEVIKAKNTSNVFSKRKLDDDDSSSEE